MELFKQENRVICGKCSTEFDLIKNEAHCPLCGFGKNTFTKGERQISKENKVRENFPDIPPKLDLTSGKIKSSEETKVWGSWIMFNDFFAPKFLMRVLAWKMYNEKKDYIKLSDLMEEAISLIDEHNLSHLKGFPNLNNDPEGDRLVHHFLRTFVNMGLTTVKTDTKIEDIWKEKRNKIDVALTKEGLEFSRLSNSIFDEGEKEQILSKEERDWILNYLKKIDKENYKEYSVLKEVFDLLKSGKNGNKDLWEWFEKEKKFQDYIKKRSIRARSDPKIYQKQLKNYARTFASVKISLLRELGLIKNKRNDYSIIGEL